MPPCSSRSSSPSNTASTTASVSTGTGTEMPSALRIVLVLAQQHVEHDAVDLVVDAVVGDDPHLACWLAVAVDAAFALLVAGRVPGQVVVHDRVEVVLQVDALAQAVGGDQHALLVLGQAASTRPRVRRAAACR